MRYVAVEGVIGAGKTTYAKFLSEKLNYRLLLEEFEDNSFLVKFYENPDKYSFPLELSFLASRYHLIQNSVEKNDIFQPNVVSDFVIFKSLVFASITLVDEELRLFKTMFDIIFKKIVVPDLIIYVTRSVDRLKENIVERGRDYEQNIELTYLEAIDKNYIKYFKQLNDHSIVIFDPKDLDISSEILQNKLVEIATKDYGSGIFYESISS